MRLSFHFRRLVGLLIVIELAAVLLMGFPAGWWMVGVLVGTVLTAWVIERRFRSSASRLAGLIEQMDEPRRGEESLTAAGEAGAFQPIWRAARALSQRQHRMIAQLQTQRNEQEAVLQSMSNGLIALDLDQRILSINEAATEMLRLDGLSSRGRLLQEVVRQPGLNRFVTKSLQRGAAASGEFHLSGEGRPAIRADSEPLHRAGPKEGAGEQIGLLVVLTDITQLRRLESLRSDFAANVSHELRTPITNIKGYVETLMEVGVEDEEQVSRFLDIIRSNADRLAAIIEDLLALARLEQPGSRETIELSPVPVDRVVQAVVEQLSVMAELKQIRVETDLTEGLIVRGNQQLLEQALANLVSNAIKYSPSDTTVRISSGAMAGSSGGGGVEITVTDEGPGIAPQHQQRLFERFYRVDKARSREQGGTGLGLAIVKHIALVHGGSVRIESSVGRGSAFRLLLPEKAVPVSGPADS